MLPDFKLISHKFPDRPDIEIWPVADVHLGAAEHNAEAWAAFRKEIEGRDNAYIVLVGDLINNAIKSSVSNVFEETMRPRDQKKLMTETLRPLRDKVLAAVSGNHERRSGKDADDDPTYDILCKLDLEHLYRENIAFVRLQFGDQNGDGRHNPTYTLTITHGAGGGVLTGGVVNKAERFGYVLDGCDALILGHSHKPFVTQPAKISIDAQNNKVSFKPFKVISACSWLDWGGYAAQKMLPPTSIVPQVLKLYGKKKKMEVTM